MSHNSFRIFARIVLLIVLVGLFGLASAARPSQSQAAPEAPTALSLVNVSAPAINCIFDTDCAIFVDDVASTFTLATSSGSSFLQSRMFPRGEVGTPGAGLYAYEYRIDMREMVGIGNPGCVTALTLDFGPIVPLDYDGNGSLDQVYVVTGGGLGSVAPSSADQSGTSLTFNFSPPVCGDFSAAQDNGESTFFFGLASPFRDHEITAVVNHNTGDPLSLIAHAPNYRKELSLHVVPDEGAAGSSVQLIGSGYTPGGYAGNILWNGVADDNFTIPPGGAFSVPYTIPGSAAVGAHTITVCSLVPCATGEFEQSADVVFNVRQPLALVAPHAVFLPMVVNSGSGQAEPFSYVIDSSVKPFQADLPGFDGVTPRPLTAVQDPRGNVSTFVANEILVQTDLDSILIGLLTRTGGEVLLEIDPADAGITGLDKMYLVRVNLDTADTSNFAADIESLMDSGIGSAGEFAFGDAAGVDVFSIAAAEAVDGLTVGINWVSQPGAIPTSSLEAPNGPSMGGVAYSPDAYDWPHFTAGTTQDIGVPQAWTLMHRAGKLGNRVDLAILDGGFYPNADFPSGTTFLNVFPFDPRNVDGVDGSAPFHGTDVLQTAVARSDDGFGIVGVAAPIARPIALYTSYDYVVSIASLLMARAAGVDVINMSYSANVPAVFGWTVWPFEATTAAVRTSGTLLFASAGNDGQNVDGEDCFLGICWEHTWHTPCENAGVICVGGLGWNSKWRAGNSNFGHESVHIYAPYTVYSGQSPADTGGGATAGIINGTSFSSPYAAGVAALIWSSNPSLSANQVWTIMRDTAHSSPDSRVNRYVNAYDAVLSAVGVGVDVTLTSPTNGTAYDLGYPLRMSANVGYVATTGSTPLQVRWFVDGVLHSTVNYSPGAGSHMFYPEAWATGLSTGTHTVMVRATAGSVVVERSATFTIFNSPPTATIDQPASGSSFCPGETITFRGSSFDVNEIAGLPDSAYAWRSNINGNLGTGATHSTNSLSTGSHTITLRVTDSGGLWDEDTIGITVLSPSNPSCIDLAPSALITSPPNGYVVYADTFGGGYWYKQVTFTGMVSDPEDAAGDLTVGWYSNRQGYLGAGTVNPSTGAVSLTSNIRVYDSCGSYHTITLRVTDTYGNITEDQIQIYIGLLC
ncbi:MAG: S8 family serine peptidase [Chloroflexota bacterium]